MLRQRSLAQPTYLPSRGPVAPLCANHSTNVNDLYPFQGPPPTSALKERSWDVVSEADVVSGKQARNECVRINKFAYNTLQ